MTEEEKLVKECQCVASIWTDDLLWYMQEYRDLGYEKVADIFIESFIKEAKTTAKELAERKEN